MKEEILNISSQIVEWQRPIRLLNSIRISGQLFEQFRKDKLKSILPLTPGFYQANELKFDVSQKMSDLRDIESNLRSAKKLSPALKSLFSDILGSYRLTLEMIAARGTKNFGELSLKAYGNPREMSDTCSKLQESLKKSKAINSYVGETRKLTSSQMTEELLARLKPYFTDEIKVIVSDGIISDAAAGGDQIKIREEATFTELDLNVFEVHEGWVHVGTTLNGRAQTHCKWLSVGPPRSAATQEGLAILMEILTYRSTVDRMIKINHRFEAIRRAFDGANFLDVFEFYKDQGFDELECFKNTVRVFRGTTGEGGSAFAKDISYLKGFVDNFNYLKGCLQSGDFHLVPLLFSGKLKLEDMPVLYELQQEGILEAPKYVPPMFSHPEGLQLWFAHSEFFSN